MASAEPIEKKEVHIVSPTITLPENLRPQLKSAIILVAQQGLSRKEASNITGVRQEVIGRNMAKLGLGRSPRLEVQAALDLIVNHGRTPTEARLQTGCDDEQLKYWIAKRKLTPRQVQRKEAIMAGALEGKTARQIATENGWSYEGVLGLAKMIGIKLPKKRRFDSVREVAIMQRYAELGCMVKVAREYGLTRSRIHQIIKRNRDGK